MEKIQPTADCIVARLVPSWGSIVSLLFKTTEPYEHYYDEHGEEVPYGAIASWTDVELPPKSKDERIGNLIYCIVRDRKDVKATLEANGVSVDEALAYLDKQKDILRERAQNITANMLEDRIKGIQRELIEFLSNTIDASWVDIIKSADSYAERIKNIIEKQKEQNPAKWSEEDEKNFYWISTRIQQANMTPEYSAKVYEILSWLESLCLRSQPHWKPSEEQMAALKNVVETYRQRHNISVGGDCIFIGVESLYNDLKKLM